MYYQAQRNMLKLNDRAPGVALGARESISEWSNGASVLGKIEAHLVHGVSADLWARCRVHKDLGGLAGGFGITLFH